MDGTGAAPSFGLTARTDLSATVTVVHTLALLPVAQGDLASEIDGALAENPLLERRDGAPCPGCGRHCRAGLCVRCARSERSSAAMPEPVVDPFHTLEAAAGAEIRSGCRAVLPIVLSHLTERGLLDDEPANIAVQHGLPLGAVTEALRAIRAAGPPGIAETTVTDLLTAQARALADTGIAPSWFATLVRDHLELVAGGNLATVAATLGVTVEEVAHAVVLIRSRLRPFAENAPAVGTMNPQPDVFVYRDGTALSVEVPGSDWFGLSVTTVDPTVASNSEAQKWYSPYDSAARRLLRQLDARADVLTRVSALALERQQAFLTHGPTAHISLTRTAVAHELGLHPSTVSRAVRGKWLRMPDGRLTALADLFGTSVAARARLAALAHEADADCTDRLLQLRLSDAGVDIARRTVAKYRAELGIAAVVPAPPRS